MLKLMGMCLILVGAAGFGRYMCSYLKKHLEQLIESREIFAQIDAGREYLKLPYAQLLRKTARGKTEVFYDLLNEVAEEMEKNKEADVTTLWEKSFQSRQKQLLLKEEEKAVLLAMARSMLLEGNHTQVIKLYTMQLEDKIAQAMEERKEKKKLYGTVSVLGGIFLVILLL